MFAGCQSNELLKCHLLFYPFSVVSHSFSLREREGKKRQIQSFGKLYYKFALNNKHYQRNDK